MGGNYHAGSSAQPPTWRGRGDPVGPHCAGMRSELAWRPLTTDVSLAALVGALPAIQEAGGKAKGCFTVRAGLPVKDLL
ncbi:hypothetical protein Aros01_01279 [Streptosporangium roseum]